MTINWNALRAAYRIISETPSKLVSLDYLRKEHEDGTVSGCGVGLCVGRPEFAESGVRAVYEDEYAASAGVPYFAVGGEDICSSHGYTFAAKRMFGLRPEDARELFSSMRNLDPSLPGLSDKEVLLQRLEEFFSRHGEALQ